MAYNRSQRLEELAESIQEQENALFPKAQEDNFDKQEGIEDPTQSSEGESEGSPKEELNETTGQEEEDSPIETDKIEDEPQDLEYWKNRATVAENRFNVSKPKYDSNIYQLKQENLQLQEDRVSLKKELNDLRQKSKSPSGSMDKLFTQETIDVLGEETVNAIKNAITETNTKVDQQEQKFIQDQLKSEEIRIQGENARQYQVFIEKLTEIVPNQTAINSNPKFLEYLNEPNAVGVPRINLLRVAEKAKDVERVASFFQEFEKTQVKPKSKDSIMNRVAPGSTSSSETNSSVVPTNITTAFVDTFYKDVVKGKYKGRYTEQTKIEKLIDKAYMENRIK